MIHIDDLLGINSRNIDYVYRYNNRSHFHLVDNKLVTKKLLIDAGVSCPNLYYSYEWFWQLDQLEKDIGTLDEFVIKPARGMAGGGIYILRSLGNKTWETPGKHRLNSDELQAHATDILYGVYSLDNTTDAVIIEERLYQHEFFDLIFKDGISDIRVILFRGEPAMAMARIPTRMSGGKANMSLGAIGAGIDLQTGKIVAAATKKGQVKEHPDTGKTIAGLTVPNWDEIVAVARKVGTCVPLQYVGIDIVLGKSGKPFILELNARPGLEIQNANGRGLLGVLRQIESSR